MNFQNVPPHLQLLALQATFSCAISRRRAGLILIKGQAVECIIHSEIVVPMRNRLIANQAIIMKYILD